MSFSVAAGSPVVIGVLTAEIAMYMLVKTARGGESRVAKDEGGKGGWSRLTLH